MPLDARSLNERITFLVAALTAGLITSTLPCLLFPSALLCASATGLLNYAGEHFFLEIALWLPVLAVLWLVAGSWLVRPRQRLSTKLGLFTCLGIAGIFIDNAVSIYQFQSSTMAARVQFSTLLLDLVGRSLLYAITFAAAVGFSCLISGRRKPTVTPPPRFGRE